MVASLNIYFTLIFTFKKFRMMVIRFLPKILVCALVFGFYLLMNTLAMSETAVFMILYFS